jgi:hypothetical protein
LLKIGLLGAVLPVALLAIVVGLANVAWNSMHRPFLDRLKQVQSGSPEAAVIELLGEPTETHERDESVDWDVEYSAYDHPRDWEAENTVLVFIGPTENVPSDYIIFVHIGSDTRVKQTCVGGT